jgi:hypothetical protein
VSSQHTVLFHLCSIVDTTRSTCVFLGAGQCVPRNLRAHTDYRSHPIGALQAVGLIKDNLATVIIDVDRHMD